MFNLKSSVVFFILLLFIFISSCSKNNIVEPGGISPQKQLTKIVQDTNTYQLLMYTDNKLSQYQSILNSKLSNSSILNYDGSLHPETENYTDQIFTYQRKFHYNSAGKMFRADYLTKNIFGKYDSIFAYISYFYNNSSQLFRTEQYNYDPLQKEFVKTADFNYKYSASGNVIEKSLYISGNLSKKTIMTYDRKINPWYSLKDYFYYDLTLSRNNIISLVTSYPNSPSQNLESEYSYTYDSNGYPLTCEISVTSGGNKSIINRRYEYQ